MKKIINILIIIISFIVLSKVCAEEYEEYHSGDLVRYKDIAFYVLFDSDSSEESIQLLKMVPLSHEEINKYTDGKAIKLNNNLYSESLVNLENESFAYGNMAYYYSDSCYGSRYAPYSYTSYYSGCSNDYNLSNVKKVVDLWTEENFDNEDIIPFEDGYKSRLIKVEEYLAFDTMQEYNENTYSYNLSNLPNWLIKINYNNWTIDKRYESSIYALHENKLLFPESVYNNGAVRPTIKLKKSSISRVSFNEYHNNAVREYKIGDIINYNDTKFYVIKDSSDSDSTVTLLKDIPLTKYELETYGEGYINNYIYSYNWDNVTPGTVIFENGLNKVAYLSTNKCYSNDRTREYDLSGCNQNYDVSNVKHIVDNWTLSMINNSDITEDEIGYSSRLIDSDDLTDLGYISIQANTSGNENFKTGKDTPEFMSNDNTKGMLTMIPSYTYNNGTEIRYGITVADDGYVFLAQGIPNGAIGTVRPVVTLNKKEIAPKITNVEEIEDTVNGDSEANNIEVDIVSNVDNTTNINTNTNNVEVPNTLSSKNITIIFVGLIVLVAGIITFIYYKKK